MVDKSEDGDDPVVGPLMTEMPDILEVEEEQGEEGVPRADQGRRLSVDPHFFSVKNVTDSLNLDALKTVIYELGIIPLCWPVIEEPVYEGRTSFPESYYTNTEKEKLNLAYAENFRQQFCQKFVNRKQLLLQAPNECGLQKMVCTTIRPTLLPYTEMRDWDSAARFVGDFLDYEPLRKPILLPERLLSPYTVLKRQSGNCFEVATVLVSYLVGAGYSAHVVVGYATADVCNDVRTRKKCQELPDENPPPPPEETVKERKYKLTELPDLKSKHVQDMEQKLIQKMLDIENKEREQRLAEMMKLVQVPPDELHGWRLYSWVLVCPPERDITEPFFVDAVTGEKEELSTESYLGIESVYNHANYYVNLQDCSQGIANLSYELGDNSCWEHLLPGEPMETRQFEYNDTSFMARAMMEKHLDMPYSWVERLDILIEDFKKRYPGGHKVTQYEKSTVEKIAPYHRPDGMVKLIKTFEDYDCQIQLRQYEWYENRADRLIMIKKDLEDNRIVEKFRKGREDFLKEHSYDGDSEPGSIEANRNLEFYYYSRVDHLKLIKLTPRLLYEEYQDRDDRLLKREIIYGEPVSEAYYGTRKRPIISVTEWFARNPEIPAAEDIAMRMFAIGANEIHIIFHYEDNYVTMSTRDFVKPNVMEAGGRILYCPDLTNGYIANPNGKPPRNLKIYYLLCSSIEAEENARKLVRDYETEMSVLMRARRTELVEPVLEIHLFDTERNEFAKRGLGERFAAAAEQTERDVDVLVEHLSAYAARSFGRDWPKAIGQPLSATLAALMREQCLADFKDRQLARQAIVQARFEENNAEYFQRKVWYLANQFTLSPQAERAYFQQSANLAFREHVLEVQLSRFRALSGDRYQALDLYLRHHPMMSALYPEVSSVASS